MEGDDGSRMDPDDSKAASVALQKLSKGPHEDRSDLLVLHGGLNDPRRRRREGVVGARQLGLKDLTQGLLGLAHEGLVQQGEGHSVGDVDRAPVQVRLDHVHLKNDYYSLLFSARFFFNLGFFDLKEFLAEYSVGRFRDSCFLSIF